MANNRIYLRCKACGETLFLGKCFSYGYYWQDYGYGSLSDQLNKFYDEHTYCAKHKKEYIPYDQELFPLPEGFEECEGAYDIVYESNWGTGLPDQTMTIAEQTTFLEGFQAGCKSMEKQGYVKPVRCEDCKHRDPEDKKCDCAGHEWLVGKVLPVADNWFCADGERRER